MAKVRVAPLVVMMMSASLPVFWMFSPITMLRAPTLHEL